MIRIIHLSDLHIRGNMKEEENKNARLLREHLKSRYPKKSKGTNYVVITGDIVHDGNADQYRWLKRNFLSHLKPGFEVLCAPGNHDYATEGMFFHEQGRLNFLKYVCGDAFPRLHKNGRESVVFIGLDSADPNNEKWLADGVVGQKQRDELEGWLNHYHDHLRIVYLHHHPFYHFPGRILQDAEALLAVLEGRADLLLFGHKHRSEAYFDSHGVDRMLASGKVTEQVNHGLHYRVITIDNRKIVSVRTEEVRVRDYRTR